MTDFAAVEKLLSQERLPLAWVDLNVFDENVKRAAEIASSKNKKIRIATKSIRVPELIERVFQIQKNWPENLQVYQGLMCFTAEEALFLAESGLDNLLIAYPTVQTAELEAVARIQELGKSVSIVVDCDQHLRRLEEFFSNVKQSVRVILEIDCSLRWFGGAIHLGVRRSRIRNSAEFFGMVDAILQSSVVRLAGVMTYEAQVAGVGDRNPFKPLLQPLVGMVRKISRKKVSEIRQSVTAEFESRGMVPEILNGGGTGSLRWTIEDPLVNEVTVGSGLLCSHLFDYYSDSPFKPASFFGLQVVRSSDPGYVTCQGGGYLASGEIGIEKQPRVVWPLNASLIGMEGCGEVQTPLRVLEPWGLGRIAFFRHAKAGELAERFNEYLLVKDGHIESRVKTYRGMGRAFL